MLMLVDQGLIDVHQPVANYWPEFAQNVRLDLSRCSFALSFSFYSATAGSGRSLVPRHQGKDKVTVEQALSHQAAVVTYRKYLGPASETTWEQLTSELAAESLFWELGTETRYHAFTFGILAGELVRRVSGQTVGAFLKEHIADKHSLDMHIGIPEEMDARVADLIAGPGIPSADDLDRIGPDDVGNDDLAAIGTKTMLNPLRTCDIANTREWRGKVRAATSGARSYIWCSQLLSRPRDRSLVLPQVAYIDMYCGCIIRASHRNSQRQAGTPTPVRSRASTRCSHRTSRTAAHASSNR